MAGSVIYLLSLLAACANALSSVLQRRAASTAPDKDFLSSRLVLDLLRRPVWFAGMASLIVGFLLQAAALHSGPLSTVEPILIVELALTLLLARLMLGGRLARSDWLAIAAVTVGLALALWAAAPAGGHAGHVDTLAWLIAIASGAGMMAVLTLASLRGRPAHRAALLGAAAGAGFGLSATLIKGVTTLLGSGVVAVLGSWKLYAMVVAGVASLFLFQNAVQAGRLIAAQPAITIADPVVSVLYGVLLFGEHLRGGPYVLAALGGVALVLAGTIELGRSPLVREAEAG